MRLALRPRQFRCIFSARARWQAHSGELEAQGVVLALRRLLRCPRVHGHRSTFLVDAQVVRAAMQKGRSSAPTLRRAVAQAGALCLAADFRLRFGYLPTESNPADAPSREQDRDAGRPSNSGGCLSRSCTSSGAAGGLSGSAVIRRSAGGAGGTAWMMTSTASSGGSPDGPPFHVHVFRQPLRPPTIDALAPCRPATCSRDFSEFPHRRGQMRRCQVPSRLLTQFISLCASPCRRVSGRSIVRCIFWRYLTRIGWPPICADGGDVGCCGLAGRPHRGLHPWRPRGRLRHFSRALAWGRAQSLPWAPSSALWASELHMMGLRRRGSA